MKNVLPLVVIALLTLLHLTSCSPTSAPPVVVRPQPTVVAPPPLEVDKTVEAVKEVEKKSVQASAQVTSLQGDVKEAHEEVTALKERVANVVEEGISAQSEMAEGLHTAVNSLVLKLKETKARADEAIDAQISMGIAVNMLEEEVVTLNKKAGQAEQAMKQALSSNAELTEDNNCLLYTSPSPRD